MKLDWKKETRRVVSEHIDKGQPMSFVLPEKSGKCSICDYKLKNGEYLHELDEQSSISIMCSTPCWMKYWWNQDHK